MPTPLKAIRKKCLECSGGSPNEVKLCTVDRCELWYYRFGKNPNRKPRIMSEEQKEAAVKRLAKAREAKT